MPEAVTRYVFVRTLPAGSVATTATSVVPEPTGAWALKVLVDVVWAGFEATVTDAGSFVLPLKASAPPGCRDES